MVLSGTQVSGGYADNRLVHGVDRDIALVPPHAFS